MQIIYPDDYSNQGRPDENFAEEFTCAKDRGIRCFLLSSEAAALGKTRFSGRFEPGVPVIWRGWMLNAEEYRQLHRAVTANGGEMLESPDEYLRNHHITGWYEPCKSYTAETVLTTADTDFDTLVTQLCWPAYFVKDYVKSLTTSRGSVAHNATEIREVLKLIMHYRGELEGGVSLRRFENLFDDSERRYFSLNGQVFSADGEIPDIVHQIASRIKTPFYSIDIAKNANGELRLIEIGDGQVSDTKEWSVADLVTAFCIAGG